MAGRFASPAAEREAPFFFSAEGVVVTGIMDHLCREPECWFVSDYKTNALRGRAVAEVAEPYGLQCVVYGLAALRAGAPAVQLDLVFLERPEEPVSVKYLSQDLTRLERELTQAFSGVVRGEYPRKVGDGCAFCSVAGVCGAMVAD